VVRADVAEFRRRWWAAVTMPTAVDRGHVTAQLGRTPRGAWQVAHRCPCGRPDVLANPAALPDGTPFPTHFYLTCPRAAAAVGRVEASGIMRDWQAELDRDPLLAQRYRAAHVAFLAARAAFTGPAGVPAEIAEVSAGGMPRRVKCLHACLAQALAMGAGVNPFGDRVQEMIGAYWESPCQRPA